VGLGGSSNGRSGKSGSGQGDDGKSVKLPHENILQLVVTILAVQKLCRDPERQIAAVRF
jgi:hypothetical protein